MKKILFLLMGCCVIFFSPLTFAANNVVRFGTLFFYPPFVSRNSLGHSFGFDIAIAQAICEAEHLQCVFQPMPFYDLFPALNNNKVDAIISSLSITSDRKAKYDFTNPYYHETMSYLSLKKKGSVVNNVTLADNRIGVVKGTIFVNFLKKHYPNSKVLTFDSTEEAIEALSKGRIDVILSDTLNARWWALHSADQFVFAEEPTLQPGSEGLGIAVRKGNTTLLNLLNDGLQRITSNGQKAQIENIYVKFSS